MKVKIEFAFSLANSKVKFIDTAHMQPSKFFHHQYLIRLIDEARADKMGWSPTDLSVDQFNEIFDSEFDWETMKLIPKEFEYDESKGYALEVGIYVVVDDYKGIHPGLSKILAAETNDEKYDAFVEEFANYRSEQIPELDAKIFSDPILVARLDKWVNEKAAGETQTKDYVFNIDANGVYFTKKSWMQNGVPADLVQIDASKFGEDLIFLIPGDILVDMGGAPVHVYGTSITSGAFGIQAHEHDGFDYETIKQPLIDAGFEYDSQFEFGEPTTQKTVMDKLFSQFEQDKINQAQHAAGQTTAPTTQQIDQAVKDALNGVNSDIDLQQTGIMPPIGQDQIDAAMDKIYNAKTSQEIHDAVKSVMGSVGGIANQLADANPAYSVNDQIVKAIKSGRSLRDIGREFGMGHQKVAKIGEAAGVYSSKSKKNSGIATPEDELPDDLEALYNRK